MTKEELKNLAVKAKDRATGFCLQHHDTIETLLYTFTCGAIGYIGGVCSEAMREQNMRYKVDAIEAMYKGLSTGQVDPTIVDDLKK